MYDTKKNFHFHFKDGAVVEILKNADYPDDAKFDVRFFDGDKLEYQTILRKGEFAKTNRKYVIPWNIEIYYNDSLVFEYKFDIKNRVVLISMESSALGDTLAWAPYVEDFQKKYNCIVYFSTFKNFLLENTSNFKNNSKIKLIPKKLQEMEYQKCNFFYKIGCYEEAQGLNKVNWRQIPMQQIACDILNVDYSQKKINLLYPELLQRLDSYKNKIPKDKYIVIAPNSTMKAKLWNNPEAWSILIKLLKEHGYRIIQIGYEKCLKEGAENYVNTDLYYNLALIYNSELFIGLGSGLTWCSWCLDKNTVMISPFSDKFTEFEDEKTLRIENKSVCNSCFNNIQYEFNRGWDWCPAKKDFMCTKSLSPFKVYNLILKKYLNFD